MFQTLHTQFLTEMMDIHYKLWCVIYAKTNCDTNSLAVVAFPTRGHTRLHPNNPPDYSRGLGRHFVVHDIRKQKR